MIVEAGVYSLGDLGSVNGRTLGVGNMLTFFVGENKCYGVGTSGRVAFDQAGGRTPIPSGGLMLAHPDVLLEGGTTVVISEPTELVFRDDTVIIGDLTIEVER